MAARASATKQAIAVFAGGGVLIGTGVGGAMYLGGVAVGGSFTTLGNLAISADVLSANVVGAEIVGWGSTQIPEMVAQTVRLAGNLTEQQVKTMIYRGLTREWVEKQLAQYANAVTQGGAKLNNAQLLPRKALMEKILSLWPK